MSRYAYTFAGLLLIVALMASHWKAYTLGRTLRQAEYNAAVAAAVERARAVELERINKVQEAQNAAAKRAQAARRDADSARTELDRLRQHVASTAASAGDAPAASPDRAAAHGELLVQCSAAYQDLARVADGHANDVRTLIEAWPKR